MIDKKQLENFHDIPFFFLDTPVYKNNLKYHLQNETIILIIIIIIITILFKARSHHGGEGGQAGSLCFSLPTN